MDLSVIVRSVTKVLYLKEIPLNRNPSIALFLEDLFQAGIIGIIFTTATTCFISGNITAVTKTSCDFYYDIDNHMKPFTDVEIVKECFLNASNLAVISVEGFLRLEEVLELLNSLNSDDIDVEIAVLPPNVSELIDEDEGNENEVKLMR
ncbi:hypothetical protein TNCV_374671 [Trichonephila clavipes]|nr:hypothetical protein TNCV_374671 [Trichonephila clavipes]